ncbi:MAG: signal peptidase I [Propionibacteriaceae bacterium]
MSGDASPEKAPQPSLNAPQRSGTFGEPEPMSFAQHLWAFVKELFVVVVGAVIVASLIRALVGQMFLIPSESMENTLLINDRVVVEKLSSIKRGQVVVFADPGGWLTGTAVQERGRVGQALEFVGVLPDTSTEHLIKRAIGMPGDRVVCCDAQGRITVNGSPLDETAYLYTAPDGTQVAPSEISFDVVVPSKRIFVMGDNRPDSRDSRCHLNDVRPGTIKGENAFVSEDLVVGRAIAVVWPVSDAKRLTNPKTLAAVPEGQVPAPAKPVIDAGPEADC